MTATGLNIIGRIGWVVFSNSASDPQVSREYFSRLAALDWKKASSFWAGTVIGAGTTRVVTMRGPLEQAFHKVRKEIDIPSDWLRPSMRKRAEALDSGLKGAA